MNHRTKILNVGGPLGYHALCSCGFLGEGKSQNDAAREADAHVVKSYQKDPKDPGVLSRPDLADALDLVTRTPKK